MTNTLADVPHDYSFAAKNSYVKGKMYWSVTIIGSANPEFAAFRVLDGLNQFPIDNGELVAVRGKAVSRKE